jgi:hypothetical protein
MAPVREDFSSGKRTTYLTIHTAGFQTGRWRFFDGASPVWSVIRDEQFNAGRVLGAAHETAGQRACMQ